jgi:hypothetical protein
MSDPYDIGEDVTVFATFKDDAGVVGDPDDVQLVIRPPDDELVTVELEELDHPSEGRFEHTILNVDQPGLWRMEWRSESELDVVEPDHFYVRRSAIT